MGIGWRVWISKSGTQEAVPRRGPPESEQCFWLRYTGRVLPAWHQPQPGIFHSNFKDELSGTHTSSLLKPGLNGSLPRLPSTLLRKALPGMGGGLGKIKTCSFPTRKLKPNFWFLKNSLNKWKNLFVKTILTHILKILTSNCLMF